MYSTACECAVFPLRRNRRHFQISSLSLVNDCCAFTLIPVFLLSRVLPSPIAAASYFLMASSLQPPPRTAHSFAIHGCHDHISRPTIVNRSADFSDRTHHLYSFANLPKVSLKVYMIRV